jgi:pimeloyl-ACP methyl ester carboxylesterase
MSREGPTVGTQFLVITALLPALVCLAACQPTETSVESSETVNGTATVNDVELYYQIHGDGTPLVLLHGGLGHSGHWKNQIPFLSEHYKVIAVDSRGHGRSTSGDRGISYELMASDVIALMDNLGVEKAHVLGWSDGGILGLYLAVNRPERLIKVIASGANYDPSGIRPNVGEHPKFVSYITESMMDYQTLAPEPSKWESLLGNVGQMWATEPTFTAEELGSINSPVLLLDGDNEEAIYPEHTREMASLIPTAKLVLVPGTGHFGFWEKPAEMNNAILEFLSQ